MVGHGRYLMVLAMAILIAAPVSKAGTSEKSRYSNPTGTTLSEEISQLEGYLGLNPAQEGAAEPRIAALENRLLGKTEEGSLISRIDRLKRVYGAVKPGSTATETSPAGFKLKSADPILGKAISLLPLPNSLNADFVRIDPPGSKSDAGSDYLAKVMEATKGKVVRFKQMPIPVFIAPSPNPNLTKACLHGIEMWEERSDGMVRFVQVDWPERARIKVIWSHLGVSNNPQDCNMGAHTVTKWQPSATKSSSFLGGSRYVVPPQIIEVNLDLINAKPEEVRLLLLKNVIAHELGHALGLLGHSPVRSDLLFAVTDECSRLSQRDLNTLKKLYEAKIDVSL